MQHSKGTMKLKTTIGLDSFQARVPVRLGRPEPLLRTLNGVGRPGNRCGLDEENHRRT